MENVNKRRYLTEHEKWHCTVRWLNALYNAFVQDELISENEPCPKCPCFYICPCGTQTLGKVAPMCIPDNFKVLERFTGTDTVTRGFAFIDREVLSVPLSKDASPKDINHSGKDCTLLPKDIR